MAFSKARIVSEEQIVIVAAAVPLADSILTFPLSSPEQPCRLYATKHLRVLLRAGVEFFSSWGMELLATQLHDHSKAVSMEALDVLDEACEDKVSARVGFTGRAATEAHPYSCLSCFTGQPPRSDTAEASSIPPGR